MRSYAPPSEESSSNGSIGLEELGNLDFDAPDNTIAVNILKQKKIVGGRYKKITKKIFLLDNGAQHIVEIEEA